jgi:hypothetical protein
LRWQKRRSNHFRKNVSGVGESEGRRSRKGEVPLALSPEGLPNNGESLDHHDCMHGYRYRVKGRRDVAPCMFEGFDLRELSKGPLKAKPPRGMQPTRR